MVITGETVIEVTIMNKEELKLFHRWLGKIYLSDLKKMSRDWNDWDIPGGPDDSSKIREIITKVHKALKKRI